MTTTMRLSRFHFFFILSILSLTGCATYKDIAPGTRTPIYSSAVVSTEKVTVETLPPEAAPARDYRVGPGDILLIDVNGRPEFIVATPGNNGKAQGSRVDGAGNIHLPMAGAVQVGGLTLSEIEGKLSAIFRKYLQNPWVVAEVLEYKSQPVYLLGQFRASGTYYMDRPLTLLQGIALGNGFDSTASLSGARLIRNGKTLPVDIYNLLQGGDTTQNAWLKGGDTIYIPDNRNQQVFIFGAVKKPGPVPITPGGLNLAQAIASAELRETGYDFHHVRIIRSISATRGELQVVDFDRVLRGQALPIPLEQGDIIYVPKSGFGTWNDVIADILPSLQTVSAVLQPFVSIKFLKE
ncbi:polysaccharide biosynthesis/export family protein [Geomonas sp. RF6]|uniref:polysaccharide biosynthesis/export family protein n=1 Tax=Geomonas sp. RF6 TaxID=2897342 RepID=UPI001E2CFE4F|nr:polysaccharide biosynthesis/export family protein [Geomonas sp. RF6]UFS69765.1 polysaccharide biosynthesis/export family protein [Geomonas sp. RF6]